MPRKKVSSSQELAQSVVSWALEKKGEDLVLMDLREILDVTDCFVIATGASELQVQAIADHIVDCARAAGQRPLHVEGRESAKWVLIDLIDVVVHVMLPEPRMHYGLERLWGDAPLVRYGERGEIVQSHAGREASR